MPPHLLLSQLNQVREPRRVTYYEFLILCLSEIIIIIMCALGEHVICTWITAILAALFAGSRNSLIACDIVLSVYFILFTSTSWNECRDTGLDYLMIRLLVLKNVWRRFSSFNCQQLALSNWSISMETICPLWCCQRCFPLYFEVLFLIVTHPFFIGMHCCVQLILAFLFD